MPLLVVAALVATATAASASPSTSGGVLGPIEIEDSHLRAPLNADLTGDTAFDRDTVHLTVDGVDVPATATLVSRSARPIARSEMLLLDISGSMRGDRLAQAKSAAHSFLSAVPTDVTVGLTVFSDRVQILVPPTHDRARVGAALDRVDADGTTHLNEAVVKAVRALGSSGDRRVLLLSDGADAGSTTTTEQASALVRKAGVALSAVALGDDRVPAKGLRQLATAGRGQLVSAVNGGELSAAFRAVAKQFREQLLIQADLPPGLSGRSVTVAADIRAGGSVVHASARTDVPQQEAVVAGSEATVPISAAADPSRLRTGALVLFAGLAILLLMLLGPYRGKARQSAGTRALVDAYTLRPQSTEMKSGHGVQLEESPVAQALLRVAGRVLARTGRGAKLAQLLDQAGMTWEPRDWLLLQAGAAVGVGLLLAVLARGGAGGFVLGLVIAVAATEAWLRRRAAARRAAFVDGLPDALQLVSSGLSTGYSFAQAVDSVVREGMEPVSGEFGRALAESRLGVPLEDALETTGSRMGSQDLHWVVMAVRVQREVGGNLAEVLHTVFETMRERARIRRQVRTLSAEGRMSAWVLIALPIFMAGFQLLFRRDYMRPLYTEPAGIVMLMLTVVAVVLGAVWTTKVAKVEA